MDAHDRSQLFLDWQNHRASLSGEAELLSLGASGDAQLSVQRTFTSKHHAHIEREERHDDHEQESVGGGLEEPERVGADRRGSRPCATPGPIPCSRIRQCGGCSRRTTFLRAGSRRRLARRLETIP